MNPSEMSRWVYGKACNDFRNGDPCPEPHPGCQVAGEISRFLERAVRVDGQTINGQTVSGWFISD